MSGPNVFTYVHASPLNFSDPSGLTGSVRGNIGHVFDDWITFMLSLHYLTGGGKPFFVPKSFCDLYLSDPDIQRSLQSVKEEIEKRLQQSQDFSFVMRTDNYVTSIFAFAGGHDNFLVECSGGVCSVSVNRQDDYADPQDINNLKRDGSKYLPESNKYGTPFQFGITCDCEL